MRRSLFKVCLAIGVLLSLAAACAAQGVPAPPATDTATAESTAAARASAATFPNRELIVGTKEAPPFAMKDAQGKWSGISIDLWAHIADKLGVKYRLVEEPSVQDLIASTDRGDYDISVAAITITAERERTIDFSQPFYGTGLGIAVPVRTASVWREIIRTMTSFGFLQAVGALIGISLLVGMLIWLFERRHNDDFGGGAAKGLGASIWWSAEAMTQARPGIAVRRPWLGACWRSSGWSPRSLPSPCLPPASHQP